MKIDLHFFLLPPHGGFMVFDGSGPGVYRTRPVASALAPSEKDAELQLVRSVTGDEG
jgi:hypothetical protein